MKPLVAAFALLLALATPAVAKPEVFQDAAFAIFPDTDNQLVAFLNITRDDFCAWADSDFDGEPPVTSLIETSVNQTPTGAIVFSRSGTSSFELWALDADADLSGPCQDTDDSAEPWAVGTADWWYRDNDVDHDVSVLEYGLRRTNSFGEHGLATVFDGSGAAWSYRWKTRVIYDKNLEAREAVAFSATLSPAN